MKRGERGINEGREMERLTRGEEEGKGSKGEEMGDG